MKNKYSLQTVGNFHEVFDDTNKITVYASTDKSKCVKIITQLRNNLITVEELK